MEDKRIAEICSDLDDMKRQLGRCAMAGFASGLLCCSVPLYMPMSVSGRVLFWTAGIVAVLAAVFVSTCSDRCVRTMTKIMRYYTETTKL